jgi:hypothetical protein
MRAGFWTIGIANGLRQPSSVISLGRLRLGLSVRICNRLIKDMLISF